MFDGKTRVAYYYDNEIGSQYYGPKHPMKPVRIRMAHHLLMSYGVTQRMDVFRPSFASNAELTQFHTSDYIDFLQRVTPDNSKDHIGLLQQFNIGPYTDCPVFPDLWNFCQLYAGASLDGAIRLNHGLCDVAINWAGGLHHAKKHEASGFCYVNDIVLALLELLKYHARVLYVDIDIHHGDGVEEAFYTTDRVMTLSFHKHGDFFPGTGALADIGHDKGKNYCVNVPLADGLDDISFLGIFKPILSKVMEHYRPSAVVLQCGADSLSGDRLGVFNLTTRGHGEAIRFTRSFGIPTLVVGGGGYNIRNVARCWAYETALCANVPLSNTIPLNDYYSYFAPEYQLHLTQNDNLLNSNSREALEKIKVTVFENLKSIEFAPSVQMHYVPPDMYLDSLYTPQLAEGSTYNSILSSQSTMSAISSSVLTIDGDDMYANGQHEKLAENEFFDNIQDNDILDNTKTSYGRDSSARSVYHGIITQGQVADEDKSIEYEYSVQY